MTIKNIAYLTLLSMACTFFSPVESKAAAGDTLTIQAFTFGSTRDSMISFPPANMEFEKIYMYYTLKCNPQQNPACGEWDYLTYTYIYIPTGTFDSSITSIDTVSHQPVILDTTWNVFEVIDRFELGRYITPYGVGLDLGPGFTWVFDISDYRPLLTGQRRITAGNWQELLDLKFVMIEGTPPRDIIEVQNVWNGNFGMNNVNQSIAPKSIDLNQSATMFRLKSRASGHGFDNPTSCAEFCQKNYSIKVNGTTPYNWIVWNECSRNPVYPQGGTWIFDRHGWCPGDIVTTYDHELTPYVTPGSIINLDFDIEADPYGNVILETQLISYGDPNFTLDAAVDEVIAPSKMDMRSRSNPICGNPVIRIKNTGATDLQSVLITYGVIGGSPCEYLWNGNLKFLETEEVKLPLFNWSGYDPADPRFYATVSYPNNSTDQYAHNNTVISPFEVPDKLPNGFRVAVKPDNYYQELTITIEDEKDSIWYSNPQFTGSTIYIDSVLLDDGCYTFKVRDSGEDGLGFWFYDAQDQQLTGTPGYTPINVGSGFVGIRRLSSISFLKNFDPDFGFGFDYSFTTGHLLGEDSSAYQCDEIIISSTPEIQKENWDAFVFPNPTHGMVTVALPPTGETIDLKIINTLGQTVYKKQYTPLTERSIDLDLGRFENGIYMLVVKTPSRQITKQIVLTAE